MIITSRIQVINVWDLAANNLVSLKKYDEEQKVLSLSWDPFNAN